MQRTLLIILITIFLVTCGKTGNENTAAGTTGPDTTPPTLVSSIPANTATGVAPCSGNPCIGKITLSFSESMDTTFSQTLTTEISNNNAGTTYASAPNNGTTFTWSTTTFSNDTLTINISWHWFPENSKIRYTVTAAGIKDLAGNVIGADVQRTFTTTAPRPGFAIADTGQTQCSSGASGNNTMAACPQTITGQDGNSVDKPVARSFTGPTQYGVTGNYTTTDNVTGLVWASCSEGLSGATCATGTASTLVWTNAINQCAALNAANSGVGYAGKTTWRLPTSMELESIPNLGTSSPAIDVAFFPGTVSSTYWSSSTNVAAAADAWHINMSDGRSYIATSKTTSNPVRCVAGASAGPGTVPAYTDNADGTVTDARISLRWQKCSNGLSGISCGTGTATQSTWVNAIAYCQGLSLASKTWRLPSKNELLSLMDRSKSSPAIDTTYFPATVASAYWSSSTYIPSGGNGGWFVGLNNASGNGTKTDNNYVRCVTDGS